MSGLRSFGKLMRRFGANQSGATAIEYGLIAAGIGMAIITVVFNLGSAIKANLWDKVGNVM